MELKDILCKIQEELHKSSMKYIVLDDDPTGTQCNNDVYVYLKWNKEQIDELLLDEERQVAFILTNSRSLSIEETTQLHQSLMKTICAEARRLHVDYQILSRSDSTLRWNYPFEIDAIAREMRNEGIVLGAEIICPCFIEGGRITKNDVHYANMNGEYVPVAETEFAQDKTFAYHSSNLKEYIQEKRATRIKDDRFVCIQETDLQRQADNVLTRLMNTQDGDYVIVNATNHKQLAFFAWQYLKACQQGKHFLYRGGASMLRYLGKHPYVPYWRPLKKGENGGLIVAGSHVDKTTRQLAQASRNGLVQTVTFHQACLLTRESYVQAEIQRCVKEVDEKMSDGSTVCYMTDRNRIDLPGGDKQAQLQFAAKISQAFLSVVTRIHTVPSFVIGKGGITSCQLGEMIMNSERVLVGGQIADGISIWQGSEMAIFQNIPYVVFPGNVGDDMTLIDVIETLR